MIRLTIVEALQECGHTVLEAENWLAGIEQIEQRDNLRGLVTDIRMGRAALGWEVAHQAREKFANRAVVYVTGDSAAEWSANRPPQSTVL